MSVRRVPLGDVCELLYGKSLKKEQRDNSGRYPVYGSSGVVGYHSEAITQGPTIVVGRKGSIGTVYYSHLPCWTIDTAYFVKTLEEFDLRYLYYQLGTLGLEQLDKSAAIPGLSRDDAYQKLISIPPISVQREIAATLDKADALRQKDQELLRKYDALAQSIFYEMFSEYLTTSAGAVPLSDLVRVNPTKSELKFQGDLEVSFIPMDAVSEEGFVVRRDVRTMGQVWTGFTYFAEGDVLLAKITPCMENGKGAIATGLCNGIGFGSTEFHVLRPSEHLTAPFINALLRLPSVRVEAEKQMTGSAGQKRVPKSFFDRLLLVPPPMEQQLDFNKRIEVLGRQRDAVVKQILASAILFEGLLSQSFAN